MTEGLTLDRIMVVEDEAIVALDIQKRLVAFGYRVVARVTTAEDALRKARETEPDLILMDIKIRGGLDGIETAAAIRSRQDIPIIYLTAFADEPTLARARLTEAYGYLLKPIEDRALRSAIEIALSKHRAERKLRESEERYALIARATNDGIWDWDLTTDTIYYSPRLKALLGLPEAYQLPTPRDLIDRIHPDDSARLDQAIADHLLGMTAFLNGEYRIRHQDGTYHWMMCRGLAIFDAQHKPYRFAGSLSDVTEEKINIENEKQRRKEAELLRQLTFAISSSLNLREVLDHILTGLAKAVPFDSAVITLIEDNYLKIVAQGGALRHTRHIEEKIGKSDGLFSLLESSLVPVVLGDAQTHPKYEQWSADGKDPIHGWMGIPLIAYERPIGYLMLNNQDRDIYNADHARLAQAFANQAAVAIENARLFEQVRNGRERLQGLSKKLVEIQESERRLIAHELHDEIGQQLTGLQFILTMGREGDEPAQLQALSEAQSLVSGLMAQARELSLKLHPAMLDDLGLLPALNSHFERYEHQTGIRIIFNYSSLDRRFSSEVELSTFRLIQETLTNVARYAGVKEVYVYMSVDNGSFCIRVEDFGRGFDLDLLKDTERSFGITGIRERTYLAGGKFEISSKPGEGTRVVAVFPISDMVERRSNDRQSFVGR